MPQVVEYRDVLQTLTREGLVSLYYNSGAFGFDEDTPTQSVGWLIREDPTIRQSAKDIARIVSPPTEKTLAARAMAVWTDHFAMQSLWVMPKSHWAYELDFGSRDWLPAALADIGVAPGEILGRNDGSAIEFIPPERAAAGRFIEQLLLHLAGSDFMMVFAGSSTICTIHHHKQLWWTTRDQAIGAALKISETV